MGKFIARPTSKTIIGNSIRMAVGTAIVIFILALLSGLTTINSPPKDGSGPFWQLLGLVIVSTAFLVIMVPAAFVGELILSELIYRDFSNEKASDERSIVIGAILGFPILFIAAFFLQTFDLVIYAFVSALIWGFEGRRIFNQTMKKSFRI